MPKKYYFNDLCLLPNFNKLSTIEEATKCFGEFLQICSNLRKKGFEILETRENIKSCKLLSTYDIEQWLKNPDVDIEIRRNVKSLFSYAWENTDLYHYTLEAITANALALAFLGKTIAVSLYTSNFWDKTSIEIICSELIEEYFKETSHSVLHISTLAHFTENNISKCLAKNAIETIAPTKENIFPNQKEILVEYLQKKQVVIIEQQQETKLDEQQMIEKYIEIASPIFKAEWEKNPNSKMAIFTEQGRWFAEKNGYNYNQELSNKNGSNDHKRHIYSANEGRKQIHLSIDFEDGCFEVCDAKGKHLGEYSFFGKKTKEQSDDHSIKV